MTIAPNEKIYWSDIKAICLSAIKAKCCNIDSFTIDERSVYVYGNSQIAKESYVSATSTMPYHKVTVTITNTDTVCQLVTSTTVEQQFEAYLTSILGANYISKVSTYRSILNLYAVLSAFITARLVLINNPFSCFSCTPPIINLW